MSEKFDIGARGEQLAANYLSLHGFAIVERNWRAGCGQAEHGEIDLIARRNGVLHFVEVKSRVGCDFDGDFSPEQAFTASKRSVVTRTAEKYIAITGYQGDVALDLCAINFLPDGTHRLRYFELI